MGLFLDSARVDEARSAFKTGFVYGITTNPRLLAQVKGEPLAILQELCSISHGPVFYQLTGNTIKEKMEEAKTAFRVHPKMVVIKIPCTTENLTLMAHLTSVLKIPCAATAVFSPAQGYLACEAGARYIIPYVSRVAKLGGNGPELIKSFNAVAKASGKGTEVLAASIKTPEEVVVAILAGAHHVTIPMDVLLALGNHPGSDEAIREFAQATVEKAAPRKADAKAAAHPPAPEAAQPAKPAAPKAPEKK